MKNLFFKNCIASYSEQIFDGFRREESRLSTTLQGESRRKTLKGVTVRLMSTIPLRLGTELSTPSLANAPSIGISCAAKWHELSKSFSAQLSVSRPRLMMFAVPVT